MADTQVVLDKGRIALDLEVPLPRPRRHGAVDVARLEARVLAHLLGHAADKP